MDNLHKLDIVRLLEKFDNFMNEEVFHIFFVGHCVFPPFGVIIAPTDEKVKTQIQTLAGKIKSKPILNRYYKIQ